MLELVLLHNRTLSLFRPLHEGLKRLGSPVVPFYPFSFWVPLLKPNSRKKGTLIIKGLLGNLGGLWKRPRIAIPEFAAGAMESPGEVKFGAAAVCVGFRV